MPSVMATFGVRNPAARTADSLLRSLSMYDGSDPKASAKRFRSGAVVHLNRSRLRECQSDREPTHHVPGISFRSARLRDGQQRPPPPLVWQTVPLVQSSKLTLSTLSARFWGKSCQPPHKSLSMGSRPSRMRCSRTPTSVTPIRRLVCRRSWAISEPDIVTLICAGDHRDRCRVGTESRA